MSPSCLVSGFLGPSGIAQPWGVGWQTGRVLRPLCRLRSPSLCSACIPSTSESVPDSASSVQDSELALSHSSASRWSYYAVYERWLQDDEEDTHPQDADLAPLDAWHPDLGWASDTGQMLRVGWL